MLTCLAVFRGVSYHLPEGQGIQCQYDWIDVHPADYRCSVQRSLLAVGQQALPQAG
jgi:hypothetical protein